MSSGVDVYTAVAGATGALYGPLHGGANEVNFIFPDLASLRLDIYIQCVYLGTGCVEDAE